ncbi:glycoside hydrolase family 26 protein [Kitasatospora sp. NPDC088134]|uniref:glycoside hydrolase family 26 protein n=1 Tax=Kitasatospora sp. NPDC088134 TaxID=3364071 RepID=UPI00380FDE5F
MPNRSLLVRLGDRRVVRWTGGVLGLVVLVGLIAAFNQSGGPVDDALVRTHLGGGPVASASRSAPAAQPSASPAESGAAAPGSQVSRSSVVHPDGLLFGISTPSGPSADETADVAAAATRTPAVQEYFVKWDEDFDPGAVDRSYRLGAVPLLTWEPWAGGDMTADQPKYALRAIVDGRFDAYLTEFAHAVKADGRVLVLRFAHEMNAHWYQWSETRNGNRPGDYIAAWRYVHDLFREQGATNVVWFWCPDSVGAGVDDPAGFYPGHDYVDWIGVDVYSDGDDTAEQSLTPSYRALRAIADKPFFIGEVGVRPGPGKPGWTKGFFDWLAGHPEVVGFSWFQHDKADRGRADWRFTTSADDQRAFVTGLLRQRLGGWP